MGLREGEVTLRAMMPEAAVDEDGYSSARICDVWMSWSSFPIEPVSWKAHVPEHLPCDQLGLCALAFVGAHGFGYVLIGRWRDLPVHLIAMHSEGSFAVYGLIHLITAYPYILRQHIDAVDF